MEEDKAQRKQAEDKGVFLRFGDEGAVDADSHRTGGIRRKCRLKCGIIEGSRNEVADRFVQNAGTHPSRSIPAGIAQIASGDANPKAILITVLRHPKVGNDSASTGNSDSRRVGGTGSKGDVGSASARNSGSHRSDVFGIETGKEGRSFQRVWLVGLSCLG